MHFAYTQLTGTLAGPDHALLMAPLCSEVALRVFFTSTRLFVQELVPGGTVAIVTDSPVPADVRAAAVVV